MMNRITERQVPAFGEIKDKNSYKADFIIIQLINVEKTVMSFLTFISSIEAEQ